MASNYKTGASLNLTPFEMQLLSRSPLFRGAGESGIGEMLSCLGAEERSYEKEEMIYRAGNTVTSLGVVMHGSVMIVNDDLWGNRSILDRVEPGQIFAAMGARKAIRMKMRRMNAESSILRAV